MLDIKFVRENPEEVKNNIRNKFQDGKLPLVDEVIELDKRNRSIKQEVEALRAERNKLSKQIGALMGQGKKEEAEEVKKQVTAQAQSLEDLSEEEKEVEEKLKKNMMVIPNIIDPSVPIGKDDSENVEIEKFGEPVVPDFEVPYHTEIMEKLNGIDLDSARKVAGNGFYYLMGDIARLHSSIISYARDFMIDKGFTYCIPPFMIRSDVVTGVMSFAEMDAMMYKIEGEDLYLIGTSEHSMIGKFIDTVNPEEKLPFTFTSYSPCFRKEKGAHGLEERGVYRIHQFEKQEMIVVCNPEDSKIWFDKLWQNTVELFRSLDIPVRTLECCSGDLADLKVKSIDVEAWSPRQKKYFEVGSCSNLGDAQARRLKIRVRSQNGNYFAHTLNNTVVAPPRMLIAFLENNLNADGSVNIPAALVPYMKKEKLIPNEYNVMAAETFDKKRVYFYECDYCGRFKISEILKLAAELAGHDYTQKGFSHEFLWERDMVFLVSKVSFHIFSYPQSQQMIISSTWEKETKGAVFMREFQIKDESGKLLVQGISGWILVNPKTRRIIKPSAFNFNMPKITDRTNVAVPIGKIKSENSVFAGSREIRKSDLDANGHVYNAVYADMAIDFISEQTYEQSVENFRIDYISEAKLGDIIDIYVSKYENKVTVTGIINEKTCFDTEFTYK